MINEELVREILGKKKKPAKVEEVQLYKDEIIQLRKAGLSLQDICFYLRKEHKLKVSSSTLKAAIPELENRIGKIKKIIPKMTNEELKETWKILENELEKRGLVQRQ